MKASRWLLGITVLVVAAGTASAQTPVLGNIEAPHAAVQTSVKLGEVTYGPGAVAYGPVGTPLVLTGSALGGSGTVLFVPYKNGVVDSSVTPAQATVTMWTSNMLMLTVPTGAYTGMVTVTSEGKTSKGLPFIVTPGTYGGSCPAGPTSTQLQMTTASLEDGAVGQAYSATLGATGGTTPYSWSITSATLPSGLTLNASTGTISGTPTVASGPVDLTFEVTDNSTPKQTNDAVLSLNIESQTLTSATVYSYTANSYDGVGNLTSYTDTVMGTWGLTYDTLNRLVSGAASAGSYSGESLCWAYDPFGNRTAEVSQTTACPTLPSVPAATMSYNSNNQVTWIQTVAPTGLSYDAAGNAQSAVTDIGQTYYLYDAEGRICAVSSTPMLGMTTMTGYLYDADGNRVAKGAISTMSCDPASNGFQFTENYVLGPSGEELTMFSVSNGTSTWQRTNVYVGSKLLGTYDFAGLHFHLTDPLGTRRMQLGGNFTCLGQPETDIQSLPFGDQLNSYPDQYACPTADDATPLYFTGKERDTESGNDYFGKRYYASSMGRWMSPDRINVTEERMMNPANTLNKYAYAADNPLKYVDPDGQDITIYFEAGTPVPGHTMLLAYNQQTGDSATRSFGPDHSRASTLETAIGIPVPGTDRFGYENIKSPDDLRNNFTSYTIQTTPEEAQEVIDAIRTHPDGDYTTYWNNCTTTCSKLLRLIKQTDSHATTPFAFFQDIWGQEHGTGRSVHSFTNGQDYGHPRYDPFQMFFWLMGSNDKSSVTTTETVTLPDGTKQSY